MNKPEERVMTLDEYRDKFRKKLDKIGKQGFDSLLEGAIANGVKSLRVVGSNKYHKVYANRNKPLDSDKGSER